MRCIGYSPDSGRVQKAQCLDIAIPDRSSHCWIKEGRLSSQCLTTLFASDTQRKCQMKFDFALSGNYSANLLVKRNSLDFFVASLTMTSSVQRSDSRGKKAIFSFGDEDEDDETIRDNIQPLTKSAVDRSAFTSPHFDPDQFLSSRRHLGLERLKVELNNHLRYLKTELFELINRDYQDFINLSTNLKGVDRTIDDLKRPLTRMETQAEVSSTLPLYLFLWFD